MIFHTQNSSYELDQKNKRIRRISGNFPATKRQGTDGIWKDYYKVDPIEVGECPYVHWDDEKHCTHLSQIIKVFE